MNPVLYQEKGLIDTYQRLVQQGKHPTLARLSGKLIIYTQDRDSLIEKISQFVYQAFVTLSTFFGATFERLTQENILRIEQSFKTAILEQYGEAALLRQNPNLAEVQERLSQRTQQVDSCRDELVNLIEEVQGLEVQSRQLGRMIPHHKQINRDFIKENERLLVSFADAIEKEQSAERLTAQISQLQYDINRYEAEVIPLYEKWSQTDLVKAKKEAQWLNLELCKAQRYLELLYERGLFSPPASLGILATSPPLLIEKPSELRHLESLSDLFSRLKIKEAARVHRKQLEEEAAALRQTRTHLSYIPIPY